MNQLADFIVFTECPYLLNVPKKKTIDFSQIELPDKQLSFQEQLIQEETYRLISNAIAELPVQSGKIMRLALEGKQNKEISEIFRIFAIS